MPQARESDGLIAPALYTANFRALETYDVTFDKNAADATGQVEPAVAVEDTPFTVPDGKSLSREGYHLSAWTTNADGTGQSFAPGAQTTLSSDTKLYAQWEKDPVTVTVEPAEHGTVSPSTFDTPDGQPIDLSKVTATPDSGYELDGWYVSYDGGETWTYVKGASLAGVEATSGMKIRPNFVEASSGDQGSGSTDDSNKSAAGAASSAKASPASSAAPATGDAPLALTAALLGSVAIAMLAVALFARHRREE